MGRGEDSTTMNFSLHPLPYIDSVIKPRRLRWAGHVATMEESRSAFKMLTSKPTEKRPLGKPRRRCEDNIRMSLKNRYKYEELG